MADLQIVDKSLRSVFVGNIPYEATEEKLKEIFNQVGQVLSFKLVYDRETGKPKGYGFCEYRDQETALSAMRNLNGFEIGGRTLRVDNACTEKSRLELQSILAGPTSEPQYGEDVEPEKAPEAISKAVASLPPEQMFELMKQMKLCIQNNPTEARTMLLQNPQLAYALLQAQVVMRIVNPTTAMGMLHKSPKPPPHLYPSASENGPSNRSSMDRGSVEAPPVASYAADTNPEPPEVTKVVPPSVRERSYTPPLSAPPRPPAGYNPPAPRPDFNRGAPPPEFSMQPGGMAPGQGPRPRSMGPIVDKPRSFPGLGDFDLRSMNNPSGISDRGPLQPPNLPPSADFDRRQMPPRMSAGPPSRDILPPSQPPPSDSFDRFGRPNLSDSRGPPIPGGPFTRDRGGPPPPREIDEDMRKRDFRGGFDPRMPPADPRSRYGRTTPPATPNQDNAGQDQEKAALIMQVLQLSDEQIALLPPDQRQSIMLLKEQISRTNAPGTPGQR